MLLIVQYIIFTLWVACIALYIVEEGKSRDAHAFASLAALCAPLIYFWRFLKWGYQLRRKGAACSSR